MFLGIKRSDHRGASGGRRALLQRAGRFRYGPACGGRVRKAERWGPRTLDLDIMLFGNEVINTEPLYLLNVEFHH